MRRLYTDGWNSAAHVGLGYLGGSRLLLPFLFYQLVLQGRPNDLIDVAEYLSGWALNAVRPLSTPRAGLDASGLPANVDGRGQRLADVLYPGRQGWNANARR